jgi:hypothetical protein
MLNLLIIKNKVIEHLHKVLGADAHILSCLRGGACEGNDE